MYRWKKQQPHLLYTVHRDLLIESALQTEEIISIGNVLKLNCGYINLELKIITDLFKHIILDKTDDFSYDSNKEINQSEYYMH